MLTSSRKALLLDRLTRDGQLVVASLSVELGVSEDTLRRDLRELAAQGKLVRVHGGALPASPTHVSLDRRRALHAEEKQGLAKVAADLIADGMIVTIDGGSTHMHIAAALPLTRRATVVTHSPGVAASFEFHSGIDVVQVGGRIFRHSMVAVGAEAGLAFAKVKADLCLLGVTGLHPAHGLTTGDPGGRDQEDHGRGRRRDGGPRHNGQNWPDQPLAGRATRGLIHSCCARRPSRLAAAFGASPAGLRTPTRYLPKCRGFFSPRAAFTLNLDCRSTPKPPASVPSQRRARRRRPPAQSPNRTSPRATRFR